MKKAIKDGVGNTTMVSYFHYKKLGNNYIIKPSRSAIAMQVDIVPTVPASRTTSAVDAAAGGDGGVDLGATGGRRQWEGV